MGRGRGGGGRGVHKRKNPPDENRQNVTNWAFEEYLSSPEPQRATVEGRKAGRPIGSSSKKKYLTATRRAIEEATRQENFVEEDKDFCNSSMDEGEISPEVDEDEPEGILFYVSEGEEEEEEEEKQQEQGSGNSRARRGGGAHVGQPGRGEGGHDKHKDTETRPSQRDPNEPWAYIPDRS